MSEPMFVAVNGDTWVNVAHIESVTPYGVDGKACAIQLASGRLLHANTPARDFLNRMTGLVWK